MLPRKLPYDLHQTKWAAALDPVISNPMNGISVLKNVSLKAGSNVINHLLADVQQGWVLTDVQGAAKIYRSAPFNNLTLTLTTDIDVVCNIGVF